MKNILWVNLTDLTGQNVMTFQLMIQPKRFGDEVLGAVYRLSGGDLDDIWVIVKVTPTRGPGGVRDAQVLSDCFGLGKRRKVRSKVTTRLPGKIWGWRAAS